MSFAQKLNDGGESETLILVLDRSGSMEDGDWKPTRLAGAVDASIALIAVKAERYQQDCVGVVAFSTSASAVHPPVCVASGAKALNRSLSSIHPNSSTNIAAGLELAGGMLMGLGGTAQKKHGIFDWLEQLILEQPVAGITPASRKGICRIILLTDGAHNTGRSPVKVARKLKAAGMTIDCVGIGGTPRDVDEKRLKMLASMGPDDHPRYAFIGSKQKLIRKFEALANRIRPA